MLEEILSELNSRTQKVVDALVRELSTIRTGRASPALVENVMVDYYGGLTPLHQIATIATPESNLIIIQPWDRASLRSIDKAILKADIGFNPSNDGNMIRIIVPPPSEERRIELVKLVSKRVEERKVALRNMRRDSIGKLKELEKNKETSQDELKKGIKQVDAITDTFIDKVSRIGEEKGKEIREI